MNNYVKKLFVIALLSFSFTYQSQAISLEQLADATYNITKATAKGAYYLLKKGAALVSACLPEAVTGKVAIGSLGAAGLAAKLGYNKLAASALVVCGCTGYVYYRYLNERGTHSEIISAGSQVIVKNRPESERSYFSRLWRDRNEKYAGNTEYIVKKNIL